MQEGWLIYRLEDANKNRSFIDWFIEEGEKQDLKISFIAREELSIQIISGKHVTFVKGKQVALPRFVINRTIEPVLSSFFEVAGIPVFNPFSVSSVANNKSLTHIKLNKIGIPMVQTLFTTKDLLTEDAPMSYPFVIKEAGGRSGQQVHLIESNKQWEACLRQIASGDLVVQACNVKPGRDVRVFIVGKEIIGAVLRKSDNDFRANYTLGGTTEIYELKADEREIIESIIEQFEFGMVGIDFLISREGHFLFNEIEDIVGSRILSKETDINILEKYVSFIKNQLH